MRLLILLFTFIPSFALALIERVDIISICPEGGGPCTSSIAPTPVNVVSADVNPSRTSCASPCTVVFSADETTSVNFTEVETSEAWDSLTYHWDFDTDETDTHGALYDQTYTYVPGDTAYEVGYAPMVSKTFVCETGTCTYNVGMRAQDIEGNYDDEFVTITVRAEATEWSAANTVCISNTLSIGSDWTAYDKACPSGATKQTVMLDADDYDGKLVLLKKGDVFAQNVGIFSGESNYKIGYFGDDSESKPEIDGDLWLGVHSLVGDISEPTGRWTYASDTTVATYGWSENIYIEGIKVANVDFPMSSQQAGLHDVDIDREAYQTGGIIELSTGRQYCTDFPSSLSCSNVPFSKGVYISKVKVVGSLDAETNTVGLNVAAIGCDMSNFTGIVDSSFRKTGEHNLRVMGWWRLSIMRSEWLGEHYATGKQKLTTRPCVDSDVAAADIPTAADPDPNIPETWDDDPDGRTRADLFWGDEDKYIHVSRYQAVVGNVIGDPGPIRGAHAGSVKVQTNVLGGLESTVRDIIYSNNTFYDDDQNAGNEDANTYDVSAGGWSINCIENTPSPDFSCRSRTVTGENADDPVAFAHPSRPGT